MMTSDIGVLGTYSVTGGVVRWQVNVPIENDNDSVEPGGEPDVIQSLGVSSVPAPKDDDGYAEAVMLRDCGGRDLVCVGGRDTRDAAFIGKLRPGDTTVHATGPGATAQCFLKREKKQAGLAVEDASGKSMLLLLDGKNKKAQLLARGAIIEIGDDGAITLTAKGGAGIRLDDKVYFLGDLSLPGMTPGMALVQALPAPQSVGPLTNPLAPVLGVGK